MEEVTCAREGCEVTFAKKTHNQKFCTDECTRLATNERIMKNYYKDKERRGGKKRWCLNCDSLLSKYNADDICASCSISKKRASDNTVVSMVFNSSIIL